MPLLNTDTLLTPGATKKLCDYMENRPNVGMACGQLLNPDGSKQNSRALRETFPDSHLVIATRRKVKGLLEACP